MPSISLCMIVKNVETIIGNALSPVVALVDEVVIVDTGSLDGTKAAVLKAAPVAKIYDFHPASHPNAFLLDTPETWKEQIPGNFSGKLMLSDFAAARQFGLERCTSKYLLWIDSDDVIEHPEKIREIVDDMERNAVDSAMCNYDYAHDGYGNVTCKLTRERIVKIGKPSWHNPVHEVLSPAGNAKFYTNINIVHRRGKYGLAPEQQHRNLKILLKWWETHGENPDPRMLFYLAMETRFVWPDKAIKYLEEYCKKSGWDEERGVAHYISGLLHENSGRYTEAFSEYAQAAMEAYWNPDPFFGAARVAYFKNDWPKCIEWTERGFEIAGKSHGRQTMMMFDPLDRLYRPYVFYSAALVETCQMKKAKEAALAGLKYNPKDPHLIGNLEASEKWLSGKQKEAVTMSGNLTLKFKRDEPLETPSQDIPPDIIMTFAIQMWKKLIEAKNSLRALQYLDSLPSEIAQDEVIKKARDYTLRRLDPEKFKSEPVQAVQTPSVEIPKDNKLKINIWTGPAWERWGHKAIEKGIGGSETAAIHMASELTKRGHSVRMIGDHDGFEGVFDGVEYVRHERAVERPQAYPCDIFVCSRQPHAFELAFSWKASFLWVHDIHVGQPSGKLGDLLLKANRIFCLSNWHKEFFLSTYPFVSKDSIIVTKNGLDLKRFQQEPKKEGNRLIYSSSPDRGLERLLQLLPDIKKRVVDAKLHVYYGFENWKRSAEMFKNTAELEKIAFFERLLEENQKKGLLEYHGRVGQQELADAFLASKVWAYPTWFTETNCVTAMEAQAAGCVPVSTLLAALPETVSHGFLLRPPNTSEEYGKAFVNRVCKLLISDEERLKYAKAGREYTLLNHGWDRVAESWESHFLSVLKEKTQNPLPRYGDF